MGMATNSGTGTAAVHDPPLHRRRQGAVQVARQRRGGRLGCAAAPLPPPSPLCLCVAAYNALPCLPSLPPSRPAASSWPPLQPFVSLPPPAFLPGVVERISPMRTVLVGDNKMPTYVSNKDVLALVMTNESQQRRIRVPGRVPAVEAKVGLGGGGVRVGV